MKHLILGGARSGKSRYAERLALEGGWPVTYIATATAGDPEMAERIAHHKGRRSEDWRVVEEPVALAAVLGQEDASGRCLLVDCLTLWLSNLLMAGETTFREQRAALLGVLPTLQGELLLVSNEVGLGIVPANGLARQFRDEAGRLNQELATCCDRVSFVAAGMPLNLKGQQ